MRTATPLVTCVENHAVGAVGHVAVDLDAAVHRARMQDEEVAGRAGQPLVGDAEDTVVFPEGRDEAALHALELQSQHVERVGPLDGVFDAVEGS